MSKTILHKRLKKILVVLLCALILIFIGKVTVDLMNKTDKENEEELKIVEDLSKCIAVKVDKKCYEEISDEVLNKYTYDHTLAIIKKYQGFEGIRDCHEFAHYVGKKVFRKTGNLQSVLSSPNVNLCLQGFLHGAIIEHFTQTGVIVLDKNDPKVKESFQSICGTKKDFNFVGHYVECFHALGHAAMIMTGMNLVNSLEVCDMLEKQHFQESCYSGALMENFNDTQSTPKITEYFNNDDYNYPCYELAEKYLKLCYRWKGEYFFGHNKENFDNSLTMCRKIKTEFVNECILRLARSYARNNYHNKEDVLANCFKLSLEAEKKFCLRGVVELIISDVNDKEILRDYCDSSGELTDYCYSVVVNSIDLWASDTLEEAKRSCGFLINSQYKNKCIADLSLKF